MVKPHLSIDCYYHLSDHRGWQELLEQKISRIKQSGLWARFRTLRLQCCYDYSTFENDPLIKGLQKDPRITLAEMKSAHRPLGECYSIIDLREQIRLDHNPHAVLRLSTKGLTHRWDDSWLTAQQWNEYYDYWLIDQWEVNYSAIRAGHDCSGVNWHPWGEPKGHFSGTQWWAHSDYLKTIQPLKLPHTVNFEQQLPAYSPRHDAEVWIGQNSPRIIELHHYQHACVYHVEPPQNYRLPRDPN